MNKAIGIVCLALALVLGLAGCMNTGNRQTADPDTTLAATMSPMSTDAMTPAVTNAPSPGNEASKTGVSAFDWSKQAQNVEAMIDKFSEIDASRVVVSGSTALVGVKFAGEYKGEMTERIHSMIEGEVMAADPSVKSVAVTADEKDVQKIGEIADKIRAGSPAKDYGQEIDSICRNVTTMN